MIPNKLSVNGGPLNSISALECDSGGGACEKMRRVHSAAVRLSVPWAVSSVWAAPSFAEAMRFAAERFQALKSLLKAKGDATRVGDEGGFAPQRKSNDEACELIVEAITKAGYEPGEDIAIALDPAASSFSENGVYRLTRSGQGDKTSAEMTAFYENSIKKYPIVSLEDGLGESGWDGFREQTAAVGEKVPIVGDDLLVTNTHFISHRSGETEDTFMADFAVAMGGGQIKTGSVCRSERIAKYNRLLEIERELGGAVRPVAGLAAAPAGVPSRRADDTKQEETRWTENAWPEIWRSWKATSTARR
jgi:enolase